MDTNHEPRSKILQRIERHDYWHEYSDSHQTWSQGFDDKHGIKNILKSLSEAERNELLDNLDEFRKDYWKEVLGV